jgi:hypothetical protein
MSVFIKGINRLIKWMKMPKLEKTYKVWMYKAVDGRIIVTACGVNDNLLQPVGEVIEILTPHGRLIDADKLEKGFKRAIGTYLPKDPTRHMDIVNGSECRGWTQALAAVQEAKTVIEAEGET